MNIRSIAAGAALAATLGAGAQAAPSHVVLGEAAAGKVVVYRNATLIDGTGAKPRAGVSIVVQGQTITAVGPDAAMRLPAGHETVDVTGLYVLPGLIDTHVHMATPPNAAQAEGHMRRQLYSGVTAVRDMADDTRSVAELQRKARLGEIPAPDIYFAALMAGPSFFDDPRTIAVSQGDTPGKVPWMQAITPQTDMALAVAMSRGTYATAIKIYANLPGDLVKKITDEAHRQGFRVWAHSAVFPASPKEVIAAGVDVTSHVCPIAYQLNDTMPPTYQDPTATAEARLGKGDNPVMVGLFDEMEAKGIVLDATVRVYAEGEKRWQESKKGRPPRCTAATAYRLTNLAFRRGVAISTGTDGENDWRAPFPALNEELELLQTEAKIPPLEVIRAATETAARTVGREAEMGTVTPGKLANLVFVAQDPSKDVRALRSVVFTVKRGVIFKRADYRPITEAEGAEK